MTKALKNRTNCNVMLNGIQERKLYNELVIIPERSTIPAIPRINWGSFRSRCEEKWGSFRSRYHFGVELGIVSGLGINSVSGSFRGLDIDPRNHNL